jgi:hypothetical protein
MREVSINGTAEGRTKRGGSRVTNGIREFSGTGATAMHGSRNKTNIIKITNEISVALYFLYRK